MQLYPIAIIERQCFRMTVGEDTVISFELVEVVKGLGFTIQKMSLHSIGGNKAHLAIEIDVSQVLLPGLIMALKHHPRVLEFKHESEFDQLKELVKAIDEE